MKRKLLLLAWILAVIIPTSLLRRVSPGFRNAFDTLFAPTWLHVLLHCVLFAGLVVLLAYSFYIRVSWQTALILFGVVLGVGLLQEGFQALEQGYFIFRGASADVGVDLVGGLIGLALLYGLEVAKSRAY
jgi:hypothetical protein